MSASSLFRPSLYRVLLLSQVLIIAACSSDASHQKKADQKLPPEPESILTVNYQEDHTVDSLYALAKALVEAETNTDLTDVTLNLVADSVIDQEVLKQTGQLVRSQFTDREFADRYLQQITKDQTGSYTALFVHESNQVMVSRTLLNAYKNSVPATATDEINKALLALFLHELVHAADDQNFNIHVNRKMNFKASFVQSAAFEGHAQLVTRNICRKYLCLEGMDALENFMFEESNVSDPVVQSMQAVSRNVLEYSYIEGERFLTELINKPDGINLVNQVMSQPPEDPIQILVPDTYPDEARDKRNLKLKNALTSVDHHWNSPNWALVETSTIKGIDVRNNPERRNSAVEGFARLIDSMSAAQLFDQTSSTIEPIDLMLIHTEDEPTALLFAESFAKSSAAVIESSGDEVDVSLINLPMGEMTLKTKAGSESVKRIYTQLLVRPVQAIHTEDVAEKFYSAALGISGRYVIQISGNFSADMLPAIDYAMKVMEMLIEKDSAS